MENFKINIIFARNFTIMTTFISDQQHYEIVLEKMLKAQHVLWIGTADIKDLYVTKGNGSQPLLGALSDLLKKGVEIRLIHAKEPGTNFREDFDKYPILAESLERVLCNRVHFKIIVIDCEWVYVGSANLTGAGMGMKSPLKRNFEAGIFTDEPHLVDGAMEEFDRIWRGVECKKCGRKDFCIDRIK